MYTYSKKQRFLPHQYGKTHSRVSSRRQQHYRVLQLTALGPAYPSLFRNHGRYARGADTDLGSAILDHFCFMIGVLPDWLVKKSERKLAALRPVISPLRCRSKAH